MSRNSKNFGEWELDILWISWKENLWYTHAKCGSSCNRTSDGKIRCASCGEEAPKGLRLAGLMYKKDLL